MIVSEPRGFAAWCEAAADGLDTGDAASAEVLSQLAADRVAAIGVPRNMGGAGGDIGDAVEAVADVSARSLTTGFVLWGHRTFIEYLLQSPNVALRDRLLPDLLTGTQAGATGLSNAMKFLSGLEGLQITATRRGETYRLDGKLPWVTNLRPEGFYVAAAVADGETGDALVVAIPSDVAGLTRSPDLDLMAMRASNTAAIELDDVSLPDAYVLTNDAKRWLPRVRPAFLGLQCGLSIGLARRSLGEARTYVGQGRHVLRPLIETLSVEVERLVAELIDGVRGGAYVAAAARLFELRIRLAEIAQSAVELELQASGGRAYLAKHARGFQRRWREAAFVPIITPSLVQLRAALAESRTEQAA